VFSVSVCICTYNPKPDLFGRVIAALAAQTETTFDVLVVDNASTPPMTENVLEPLRARGVAARLTREETPGLIHARLRAIGLTASDWMLCVDDDNILAPDYVAEGLAFIRAHPTVAAFGGKLVLPTGTHAPRWIKPFLPFLAVRDQGDEPLMGVSSKWEDWEPPAAGAFIARAVLDDFAAFVRTNADAATLGRTPGGFASCEDSLLMHGAYRLNRATAYNPRMQLEHHINPERFKFANLLKLMEGYGQSHVVLDQLVRGPVATPRYYRTPAHVAAIMAATAVHHIASSAAFSYAKARYHLAAARAYRRLERSAQP
jgi:glycosyltransferase involved in cell wall biosynthesis